MNVKIDNITIKVDSVDDDQYPGVTMELLYDTKDGYKDADSVSRPEIRVEKVTETGEWRVLVYNDSYSEDYTDEIILNV